MNTVLIFTIFLTGVLIKISVTDVKEMRIPDSLNLILLFSGIVFWATHNAEQLPYQIANGAIVGILIWLVRFGYFRLTKRIGLGLGDVKMMGAGAIWISPFSVPILIFIASFSGLVFAIIKGRVGERIPFGPFLALGVIASWLMENVL
jgi:leader peptidase (prepilin peptidase) / N-methyltransferase